MSHFESLHPSDTSPQDPAFTPLDIALINSLGGTVIPLPDQQGQPAMDRNSNSSSSSSATSHLCAPEGSDPAGGVFLYMPCCPRALYAKVLESNQARGSLSRVAILGNSFGSLGDSRALFQVSGWLVLVTVCTAPGSGKASSPATPRGYQQHQGALRPTGPWAYVLFGMQPHLCAPLLWGLSSPSSYSFFSYQFPLCVLVTGPCVRGG